MNDREDTAAALMDPTPAPITARDRIRAKIFSPHPVNKKVIDFMGEKIEIRQPRLTDIVAAQQAGGGQNAIIQALISYTYVPGTEEKMFDDSDAEGLMDLPFGADFLRVSKAIEELSEVNFLAPKGDSGTTQPGST